MAFEELVAGLIASLDKNTEALNKNREQSAAVMAKLNVAEAPKSSSKKAAEPTAAPQPEPTAAPQPEPTAAPQPEPTAAGFVTVQQATEIQNMIVQYLTGADREDKTWATAERTARSERILKLLTNDAVLHASKKPLVSAFMDRSEKISAEFVKADGFETAKATLVAWNTQNTDLTTKPGASGALNL